MAKIRPSEVVEHFPFIQKIYSFISERKLSYDIMTSFILLFVVENIITLSFTYDSNRNVSMEFARRSMEQTSESIAAQTQRYLDDVQKVVMMCHSLVDLKETASLENKQVRECFLQSLKQYPHFATVYIGLVNGNYLGIERRTPSSKYVTQSDKPLPQNIEYLLEYQDRSQGAQGVEFWEYFNEAGDLVGEERNEVLNFDPRTRPWFTLAEQKGGLTWTDVYQFSGSNSLCVAASTPIFVSEDARLTKMAGVVGADLLLDDLAAFMQKQKVSDNGIAFIVSRGGQIVAYPSCNRRSGGGDEYGGARALVSVTEAPDRVVQLAFQKYKDHSEENRFEFKYDGKNYLASFMPIDNANGIDWIVSLVVPEKDFAKNIDDMQRREVFLIVLVALVAVIVTYCLSKRISSPIIAVAEETERLKDFYETEPLEIKSNISEIKKMIEAISAMRSSLQSFGKFVPKVLVRRLMQRGTEIKLGGKMSEVTMFFSDIQSFTSISEGMPADKLVLHLSDYFNELSKIIVDANGTIDKYIGDAIMAFWNAPTPDKNHAFNACHAALLCQKRLGELNRKWELEKKPTFPTRIGLHSTEVIVGNIGSDEKINYTLMGDGVNLGSRLEGTNKVYKTWILASEAVQKQVSDRFLFRPVDIVAVKGKQQGVKIFELVGQMTGDSRLLPSKEQVDLCTRFAQGFKLYREQRWGEAVKHFETMQEDFPFDYLVSMYVERCRIFKEDPPKRNWDGIFVLTTK